MASVIKFVQEGKGKDYEEGFETAADLSSK